MLRAHIMLLYSIAAAAIVSNVVESAIFRMRANCDTPAEDVL